MLRSLRSIAGCIDRRGVRNVLAWIALAVLAWAVGSTLGGSEADAQALRETPTTLVQDGRTLWQRDCASCHGATGDGTPWGPDLQGLGPAAVDLAVSSGRMPLGDLAPLKDEPYDPLELQVRRDGGGGRHYTPGQIDALVAYTRTIVDGPDVPTVDVAGADISKGAELFQLNCAACHSWSGRGGALASGHFAVPLQQATPTQVVEAMRTGLGTMPEFPESIASDDDAADIAAYVKYIQHPRAEGGAPLDYLGPMAEGGIAWVVGLAGLLLFVRWIGRRT